MSRPVDIAKAEAFGERIFAAVDDASLVLLASIGHRTGLLDTLSGLGPATSVEIAAEETYTLPAEHAACLTRAAGPDNTAVFAAELMMVAGVEDEVAECFERGGGVPYSSYPRFQELQGEENGAVADASLVQTTLPLVPGLVERLQSGIDVLDIGCGAGHAINVMAGAFPNSRFAGYEISEVGLALARREADERGISNAGFEQIDVAALDRREGFDLITAFDVIHDQARPAEVLAGVARALRPGGTFLMVDIAASSKLEENVGKPLLPTLYAFSVLHCMTVSLAQGGAGLGAIWGEQKALEMLADAGFESVEVKRVEGDILNNYYIAAATPEATGAPPRSSAQMTKTTKRRTAR